jgi:ATP-dependent RNA helicase DeaD
VKSEPPPEPATDTRGFAALGLDASLVAELTALGYEEPTPIQREAIPVLLAGRDVLGQAATGTGKTAAFALPILARLVGRSAAERKAPSALVLVPTRELAMQVAEAFHRYGRPLGARVLPVYGGQAMQRQLLGLRRGADVLVATPGRLLDHIQRASVDLRAIATVVLDEADEMLDMGFADDLEAILQALPPQRQTALFSATIPPRIAAIARRHLRDAVRVTIARESAAPGKAPRVREVAFVVPRSHKIEALGRILDMESPASAIVFCRTRTEVDALTEKLGARGYEAEALHGGMSQTDRDRVMRRFRDQTTQILIATDVAARGLDISQLSHVVNFDVPSSPDAYVHRIGRTGRAGREGVAVTLLEPREMRLLRSLEQAVKRRIPVEQVPTVTDVRARRMEATSAALRGALEAGDFAGYAGLVETLASEFAPLDIAAAALQLAHQATAPEVAEVEIPAPAMREEKGARPTRSGKTGGRPARATPGTGDYVRIFVPIGRRAGVRPADLVGAIANEAGVPSREIGAIDIADGFSLVEVPEHRADAIIEALRKTTIRGKSVRARREQR